MRQKQNLIGKKFGKLIVISEAPYRKNDPAPYWKCECECGNITEVRSQNLTQNITKSCGDGKHKTGEAHYGWSGYEDISGTYYCSLKKGARRRKIPFKITISQMWEQFIKQDRKCSFTGLLLTFNKNQRDSNGTASLDRIDSSKGYVAGNIQWIHKDINRMKNSFPQQHFVEMCELVSKQQTFHNRS